VKTKTLDEFIEESTILHNGKYDYSKFIYTTALKHSTIICPIHGQWEQTPSTHLSNIGCPKCGVIIRNTKVQENSLIRFFVESHTIHNGKYDYSKFDYVDSQTPGIIICPHHGEFLQCPTKHRKGHGCKKCNCAKGWVRERYEGNPATLYYAKINNLYKIGLTTFDNKRFSQDIKNGVKIEILKEWNFLYGVMAYDEEKRLLLKHKEHRYYGEKILSSGNTELFTKDVLNLDN